MICRVNVPVEDTSGAGWVLTESKEHFELILVFLQHSKHPEFQTLRAVQIVSSKIDNRVTQHHPSSCPHVNILIGLNQITYTILPRPKM